MWPEKEVCLQTYQSLSQRVEVHISLSPLPDKELRKDPDTGRWHFGDPNWDEFYQVIKGNGPCNAERLAVRRWAEEKGEWVKKALIPMNKSYVTPLA